MKCSFTMTPDPLDPNKVTMVWTQHGLSIAKYDQGVVTTIPRISLNTEELENGSVSLVYRFINTEDEGQHRCEVEYEGEEGEVDMHVTVRAAPDILYLRMDSDPQSSEVNLTCEASNFYPLNISFTFKRKAVTLKTERVTSEENPFVWPVSDGSFAAESVYSVDVATILGSTEPFTCEVAHEALDQPMSREVMNPVAPVVSLVGIAVLCKESQVVCMAEGFFPQSAIFIWRKSEEVVKTEDSQSIYHDTYSAESHYKFTPYSREPLSCEVKHMTGVSERKYVTYSGLAQVEIIWMTVAITIIIFIGLFILWWSSVGLFPLIPLEVDGVPRALQCTLTGWALRMVTVEWSRNDQQISVDDDEETLGDPPEYSMERLPVKDLCCVDGNVLRLEMKLMIEEPEGAKFKCQATHRLTRRSQECSLEI
ncbi:uncharacterized protein LOC120536163 [Polypterus senegalus]|uniref:uncharacterized protein LOC120536163 n=1 Tax=Polypterus senegalus TaxID=55291 RepID=UPI001962812C|nr:uncharacterized protein LOC120536163 [Polypterus senegalus]